MQTKEMNTNIAMRTGTILAVIAIITLVAIAMTFAKYAVQGTGEDSARVAKWGLDQSIPTDLNLFDGSYAKDGSTTVDASDGSNVIAPGTSKTADITLANFTNNEAPEVMYHFEPSLSIANTVSGQALIAKLDALSGWHWTLGRNNESATKYKTAAELIDAVEAYQQADIAPNTMPDTKTIQLGWVWDYDNSGASTWDASDTELGNLIATGDLSSLVVTLNLNAYQCQGCSSLLDPNLKTGASENEDLEVKEAHTYTASAESAGTITAVSADESIVSVASTNDSKSYTLIGKTLGNTQVTISVAAEGIYRASSKTFNVHVGKMEVDIPTAKENLVYNGSEQIGVENKASDKYDLTGNSATDASDYTATATLIDPNISVWKDLGTTDPQYINWSIDKADQSVVFTLNPSSFNSDFSRTDDASATFASASGHGGITYELSQTNNSLNQTNNDGNIIENALNVVSSMFTSYDSDSANTAGITIPDASVARIVCGSGTTVGDYNFTVKAKASGDANYNEAYSEAQSGVWTVNKVYSTIQRTVAGTTVNFLPAYSGNKPSDYDFYTKSGDTYTKINNITDMASLKTAIDTAGGAANVYTDAPSAIQSTSFYGTLDYAWENAFINSTIHDEVSAGLSSDFQGKLNAVNVSTEYFDTNDSTDPKQTGNWNYKEGKYDEPYFGEKNTASYVGYNSFYNTYSTLLSTNAAFAWSSRAGSVSGQGSSYDTGYAWKTGTTSWDDRYRRLNTACVILSIEL